MTNRKDFLKKKESIEVKTKNVIYRFVTVCVELAILAYIRLTLRACMLRILKTPFNQGVKHA